MRSKRPIFAGKTMFDGTWSNRFPSDFLKGEAASAELNSAASNPNAIAVLAFINGLKSPPGASITREKFIRLLWSPRTGGIKIKFRRFLFLRPSLFDDVDERPRFFDFIAPREQGGVPAHRVEQQTFVRFRARF